jgi:hypothetical protein
MSTINRSEALTTVFDLAVSLDRQYPQLRKPEDLRIFKQMVDDLGRWGGHSPDELLLGQTLAAMSPHDYEDPNNIVHVVAPLGREKQKEAFSKGGVELQFPDNPWAKRFADYAR